MNWMHYFDKTEPVITAENHIHSSHGDSCAIRLPQNCLLFEMGGSITYIDNNYTTTTVSEKIPYFLEQRKCISVEGIPNTCFVQGAFGAPGAVDLLETIIALGVRNIIIAGMCGGFDEKLKVGDLIMPRKVLSEEGTSHHYYRNKKWHNSDNELRDFAKSYFSDKYSISDDNVITTDAIYRQTFYKEKYWRKQKCVGVDMESSALLAVSNYYQKRTISILMVSDVHPKHQKDIEWVWGNNNFSAIRNQYIDGCVEFMKILSEDGRFC